MFSGNEWLILVGLMMVVAIVLAAAVTAAVVLSRSNQRRGTAPFGPTVQQPGPPPSAPAVPTSVTSWYAPEVGQPPPFPDPSGVGATDAPGTSATRTTTGALDARTAVRLVLAAFGAILLLGGGLFAFNLLNQKVGPGGMCGSMISRTDGNFGPCWDLMRSNAITAGVIGGALALIGLFLIAIAIFLRAPKATSPTPPVQFG